jgi:LmbE family N-acetylglucosaminyl deacetylase
MPADDNTLGYFEIGLSSGLIIAAMLWVYLAPHLDDVTFSCGGLLWEQSQRGDNVEVWTICAGDPPEGPLSALAKTLHENWGTGRETPSLRRAEDEKACAVLSVKARHFEFPDCIYRRNPATGEPVYSSSAAIFGPLSQIERDGLVAKVSQAIRAALPLEATLAVPVTLGNHVDHQLVRAAAEALRRPLIYYADYPYILKSEHLLGYLLRPGSKGEIHPISRHGLETWKKAVGCFASQMGTYWPDPASLDKAFSEYWGKLKGIQLWRGPESAN